MLNGAATGALLLRTRSLQLSKVMVVLAVLVVVVVVVVFVVLVTVKMTTVMLNSLQELSILQEKRNKIAAEQAKAADNHSTIGNGISGTSGDAMHELGRNIKSQITALDEEAASVAATAAEAAEAIPNLTHECTPMRYGALVTRHTSHVTRHTSHVTH
jgi:hypothetical protein